MTASQALLTAQTLLDHTAVLVTLDTWGDGQTSCRPEGKMLYNFFTSIKVDIINSEL